MAPRPLPSDDKTPAAAPEEALPVSGKEDVAPSGMRVIPEKAQPPRADEDDEYESEDELELDEDEDEEDEDLVVFTAKEAAGALATIWAFVKPGVLFTLGHVSLLTNTEPPSSVV